MSGPKYSCITTSLNIVIKAYTRTQLSDRIEEAENYISEIKKIASKFQNTYSNFNKNMLISLKLDSLKINDKIKKEIDDLVEKELKDFNLELYKKIFDQVYQHDVHTFQELQMKCNSLDSNYKQVLNLIKSQKRVLESKIQSILKENNVPIEEIKEVLEKEKSTKKENAIDKVDDEPTQLELKFINIPDDFFTIPSDSISEDEMLKLKSKLDKIEYYMNFYHSTKKIKSNLEETYINISKYVSSLKSRKQILELVNSEFDNFLYYAPQIEENENEFQDIFSKLKEIKKAVGIDFEKYGALDSLDKIKEVYLKVEKEFDNNVKNEYVAKSIKDVMTDFGYNVLRSDVVSEDPNQSYYDYDGTSAVSVYKNDEGAVVMELVATGDDSQMTDNETKIHLEKMDGFCTKYKKIIEALEKKGVNVRKDAEMPVDKAFVRKVQTIKRGAKNYEEEKKYLG